MDAATRADSLAAYVSSDFTSQWGGILTSHLEGIVQAAPPPPQQQEQKEQSQQQSPESTAAEANAVTSSASQSGQKTSNGKIALIVPLSAAGVAILVILVVMVSLKLAKARRKMRTVPLNDPPSPSRRMAWK
ncbi:hypothetical protein VOLCADRAFT_96503 [Volvox carteri f. nagariensis]|uniref:Uncharacterized protein n=1 Tax=Volvox carteri f. nagariensis TaxID=3068 RepID=D8UAA3_VOLCA|nr:uncharacterized protein VOLCADRAFT_96503 [Volvox carteri f. nagariensis]EFJ43443.1 hypothetical protein VOLCADRAFT_96503 [Volvox carteri f. nagariensis]|eukprot:XP_002955590.1 hypothetical protein VOLCADRAFT_96503 [Volvox carteri f. nagariensis]